MSYAKLGNSCGARTIAFTDNKKFFNENDSVYNLTYTESDRYPGTENIVLDKQIIEDKVNNTDYIKSFYGKNTIPLNENNKLMTSCGCKSK